MIKMMATTIRSSNSENPLFPLFIFLYSSLKVLRLTDRISGLARRRERGGITDHRVWRGVVSVAAVRPYRVRRRRVASDIGGDTERVPAQRAVETAIQQ